MAPTNPVDKDTDGKHLQAVESAFQDVTDKSEKHDKDPKDHLHQPSHHEKSHSWLKSLFPYNSLQDFENSWHLGNYIIDRKTGEKSFEPMSIYVRLGMHLLYYGTKQENLLQSKRAQEMLKQQSEKMGRQYDSPESKAHIAPFIQSFQLESGLHEFVQPDPSKYNTFNEFFAREIKESARPIAEPDNDKAISSIADCRLTTFPTVDLAKKYWIKGFGFTVARLVGSEDLANEFEGGSILIHRLAPQDYHRWHSPQSGVVESITDIPGTYYTVNPQAINEPGTLDVFCENRRSVMILKRPSGGKVAVIAVGAMLVGSMKYNEGVKVGAEVHRGQCLGAFYYGGSTVISLYPKGGITLDEDLVRNSTEQNCETYVQVGWHTGVEP